MNKNEAVPIVNTEKCIKCEKCVAACPKKAILKTIDSSCAKCIKYCISMKVPCNPDHYVFCYEHCDACGLCISACPVEAIHWFKITEKTLKKNKT